MTDHQFEEIFNPHLKDVSNVAFFYLGNPQDAEDVAMDVFADFYRKPPKDFGKVKAYLLRMAMNKSMDLLKKRKLNLEYDDSIGGYEEEQSLGSELIAAIREMPEKLRRPIVLFYLVEMSAHEASEAIGISEAACWKRLERGREYLKEKLK